MDKKIEYIRRNDAIRYAQWEGAYKVVKYLEEMPAGNVAQEWMRRTENDT